MAWDVCYQKWAPLPHRFLPNLAATELNWGKPFHHSKAVGYKQKHLNSVVPLCWLPWRYNWLSHTFAQSRCQWNKKNKRLADCDAMVTVRSEKSFCDSWYYLRISVHKWTNQWSRNVEQDESPSNLSQIVFETCLITGWKTSVCMSPFHLHITFFFLFTQVKACFVRIFSVQILIHISLNISQMCLH